MRRSGGLCATAGSYPHDFHVELLQHAIATLYDIWSIAGVHLVMESDQMSDADKRKMEPVEILGKDLC